MLNELVMVRPLFFYKMQSLEGLKIFDSNHSYQHMKSFDKDRKGLGTFMHTHSNLTNLIKSLMMNVVIPCYTRRCGAFLGLDRVQQVTSRCTPGHENGSVAGWRLWSPFDVASCAGVLQAGCLRTRDVWTRCDFGGVQGRLCTLWTPRCINM